MAPPDQFRENAASHLCRSEETVIVQKLEVGACGEILTGNTQFDRLPNAPAEPCVDPNVGWYVFRVQRCDIFKTGIPFELFGKFSAERISNCCFGESPAVSPIVVSVLP